MGLYQYHLEDCPAYSLRGETVAWEGIHAASVLVRCGRKTIQKNKRLLHRTLITACDEWGLQIPLSRYVANIFAYSSPSVDKWSTFRVLVPLSADSPTATAMTFVFLAVYDEKHTLKWTKEPDAYSLIWSDSSQTRILPIISSLADEECLNLEYGHFHPSDWTEWNNVECDDLSARPCY